MKKNFRAFFVFFLMSSSAFSIDVVHPDLNLNAFTLDDESKSVATYEVPMPKKYKKVSLFQLEDFKLNQNSITTTFSFILPLEIIGYKNYRIELTGPTKISGSATFKGKKADAICKQSLYGKMNCTVRYKNIDINMNRIQSFLEKKYGQSPTFSDRMDVASTFIKEPIGIISF